MTISLNQIGKRFNNQWIFKGVTCNFEIGSIYAILGANGSGKSTLLRIIGGMQTPNSGLVVHKLNHSIIKQEKVYNQLSFCAPGLDLIEEMTLREFLHFHFSFKKMHPNWTVNDIIENMGLKNSADKLISEFSSGMKQRVKLAQAFFANTPILLLDEPCSNLDKDGIAQYESWIDLFKKDRLIIIASNDEKEYAAAKEIIDLEKYKKDAFLSIKTRSQINDSLQD